MQRNEKSDDNAQPCTAIMELRWVFMFKAEMHVKKEKHKNNKLKRQSWILKPNIFGKQK